MLAEGLLTLTAQAGWTVVAAAATDVWDTARCRFVELLGRGDPEQTRLAEQRLDETREQPTGAARTITGEVRAALAERWAGRLADLLEEKPDAEIVRSSVISWYWKDTGNVTDILEVNRMVLETAESQCHGTADAGCEIIGWVVMENGAQVSGSRIVGPVIIGARAKVTGSYISPFTAMAEDCSIDDSEIEYSILLPRASIRGVRRIEASLIGHDVGVTPRREYPRPTGSFSAITARCR